MPGTGHGRGGHVWGQAPAMAESGGGGIRTHETAQHRLAVFKTAPFDRSGTPPAGQCNYAETDARRGAP